MLKMTTMTTMMLMMTTMTTMMLMMTTMTTMMLMMTTMTTIMLMMTTMTTMMLMMTTITTMMLMMTTMTTMMLMMTTMTTMMLMMTTMTTMMLMMILYHNIVIAPHLDMCYSQSAPGSSRIVSSYPPSSSGMRSETNLVSVLSKLLLSRNIFPWNKWHNSKATILKIVRILEVVGILFQLL